MKKGKKYDEVIQGIENVLVKNGTTHEEAFVILAMMQEKMLMDGLKKMKMI
jgi:hypothetical protein